MDDDAAIPATGRYAEDDSVVNMRLAATAPALVLPDAVIREGAALDPNREFHQQVTFVRSAFAGLAALLA